MPLNEDCRRRKTVLSHRRRSRHGSTSSDSHRRAPLRECRVEFFIPETHAKKDRFEELKERRKSPGRYRRSMRVTRRARRGVEPYASFTSIWIGWIGMELEDTHLLRNIDCSIGIGIGIGIAASSIVVDLFKGCSALSSAACLFSSTLVLCLSDKNLRCLAFAFSSASPPSLLSLLEDIAW